MIDWLIGNNGSGKTVRLEEILDEKIKEKRRIVTNIKEVKYTGFDDSKIEVLKSDKNFVDIFDYCEIKVINNKILVDEND